MFLSKFTRFSVFCNAFKIHHKSKVSRATSGQLDDYSYISQKRYKSSKWSYIHTAGSMPLVADNIGHFVDTAAENYGDLEAVVSGVQGIRKTYVQFVSDINEFAAGLLSLNLNVGDRFGIWSPNCYEWLVAQHAASKAGLILVPINPAFQVQEMDYCLHKVNLKALVAYDKFKSQDFHSLMAKLMPEISQTKPGNKVRSKKYPFFESFITLSKEELPGTFKFEDILNSAGSNEHKVKLEKIQNDITLDKAAYIIFTSGTTGNPKGAVLSHHSLVNSCLNIRQFYGYDQMKIRRCTMLPLFHVAGCVSISLNGLINGNTLVLTGPAYNPDVIIKTIREDKCDEIAGTTTMFVDLLNQPDAAKIDSIKHVRMGGSVCPPAVVKRIIDTWKCTDVTTGYGASEVASGICATKPDDPEYERINTSGKPIDFIEMKLVDSNGNLVPKGQPGEIYIRGYKVMLGYWGDEEKTSEAITSDGWYRSGDVGIMLDSDYIQIVDRIKDMIIRGGENIYPKEIEDFLIKHPKIREAYVIGVPDDRMGEEVCVWVQCHSKSETITEEELKEYCKEKISHFKIPRYMRLVESFPKTVSGKIQKHVMRKEEANRKR